MRKPRLLSAVVLGLGGLLAAAAVAVTVPGGVDEPELLSAFAVLAGLGELLRLNLPGDRDASPVGGAAAIGFSLLSTVGGRDVVGVEPATVVAAIALGAGGAVLVQVLVQHRASLVDVARRIIVTAVVASLFRTDVLASLRDVGAERTGQPILVMLVAVSAALVVDIIIAAAMSPHAGARFGVALRNEVRAQASLSAAMAATGLLIALSMPVMGLWALLLFTGPLLVTQFSFRRYASISMTYRQTIRALSRVTEVGGYVDPGHSRRVSALALGVGRVFGLPEAELLDLEYAALMHDIGQLSLAEPIPRGATSAIPVSQQRRIADFGAGVIRQTGSLDRVADIVAAQARPYAADVPLEARIVKVCSAYDDLVVASPDDNQLSPAEALDRLGVGAGASFYDPKVVEALRRSLDRAGRLPASVVAAAR